MKKNKINVGIIDLKINNIYSVYRSCIEAGFKTEIVNFKKKKLSYDIIILPGVGAFKTGVKFLKNNSIKDKLNSYLERSNSLLYGICLGMQLLFEESSEDELTTGLGIIKGKVIPLKSNENFKVPNMGWKKINLIKKSVLLRDISTDPIFYFVHKFGCFSKDNNILVSRSFDIQKFDCLIEKKNIFATQFHPEKSQTAGFDLLKNFINYKNI